MTLLVGTLLFSVAMIMLTKIPVAIAMKRQFGYYDNREPREQEYNLTGFGRRAMGAHENSIETFPIFAAGAIIAMMFAPDSETTYWCCLIFILARISYTLCYLLNYHLFRSITWGFGFVSSLVLMTSPL